MEQSQEKNIDLEECSQKKTKEEESDYNFEYENKYYKNYSNDNHFTSFETVIEKKDEKELNQKIKNINRGRILFLMKKIKNFTFGKEKERNLVFYSKNKSLKIRKFRLDSFNNHIKQKIKDSQRLQLLELKDECEKIYFKCLSFYLDNKNIEYECDVCKNKNGDSNEYLRFENIFQCFQFVFYLIYEKKYLFKNIYSPRFLFELKLGLKNEIIFQNNIPKTINVRTICKCCFLKFIYLKNIINFIKAIFKLDLEKSKEIDDKKNKKSSSLSFLFKVVKVG